jgi:hypothetical protein
MVGFRSGQTGQTVNLLATPSKVRILIPPPFLKSPANIEFAGLFLLVINDLRIFPIRKNRSFNFLCRSLS